MQSRGASPPAWLLAAEMADGIPPVCKCSGSDAVHSVREVCSTKSPPTAVLCRNVTSDGRRIPPRARCVESLLHLALGLPRAPAGKTSKESPSLELCSILPSLPAGSKALGFGGGVLAKSRPALVAEAGAGNLSGGLVPSLLCLMFLGCLRELLPVSSGWPSPSFALACSHKSGWGTGDCF